MKKVIKTLFLSIIFLFYGCGGGGGGSVGTALKPPSLRPPQVAPTLFSKAHQPTQFSSVQTPQTDNYNDENKISHIGITDGVFATYDKTEAKNMTMTNQVIANTTGAEGHGSKVASVVARYNNTSKLFGYDAGEADKTTLNSSKLSSAYITLEKQNTKIYNNSFGTNPTADLNQINHNFYDNLAKRVKEQDNIFVWSAGNEKKEMANDQSSLPVKHNEAKKGWIAVTSLNQNNQFDNRYANKIGERAKNWGIAALGEHTFQQGNGSGTSFAAPVVTAAVAKVWEQYPWMDNHLVVQTILSTADKENSNQPTEEPNATIGWGKLNVNRALKGPARFDKKLLLDGKDMVEVHLDYRNYTNQNKLTWSNDIKGDAGLHKKGTGTLILSGNNSYTGETKIENGALKLTNGGITGNKINIQTQGTLTAASSSNMINAKTIDNQGGIFEITGKGAKIENYQGSSQAKIIIDLASKLEASNKIDMKDSILITNATQTNSIVSTYQNSYHTLISANEIANFNGNYQITSGSNAFINIKEALYNNKEFKVSYTRNSTPSVVKALNYDDERTLKTADNFENLLKSLENDKEQSPIYEASLSVLNANVNSLNRIIDSLTGEIHATNNHFLAKQNELLAYKTAQRINYLRRQDNSGIYALALHSKFDISSDVYAGGNAKLNSVLIGHDHHIDDFMLGFNILDAKTTAKFDKIAGESEIKNHYFNLYGSYEFDDFYLASALGLGFVKNETQRLINNAPSHSQHDDKLYNFYLEAGKDFSHHSAIFTPFVAFANENITRGAFNEDTALGFVAEEKNYHLYKLLGGLRTSLVFEQIEFEGELRHSFALNPSDFDFDAAWKNGAKAYIKGAKQNKHLTYANFSTIYHLSPRLKLDTQYDLSLENLKQNKVHIFSLGLRYAY
ncbi:serine protease, subtilase family [Campylobacter upsaliensis]|uniref:Serine protease, subtilase family n=3 Tax=Campylobacter upsaliensis TaxID=28080 RepID=A0A3S4SPG0_CAMUP|nr:S8 family serine peptidase [Campylobacter upsaliensis]MCA5589291.1 S8 family serine peptidase [Campylobacter upsaliensis]VEG85544.1 serine protease, subtilase family [Campylobacter upsaliensis]